MHVRDLLAEALRDFVCHSLERLARIGRLERTLLARRNGCVLVDILIVFCLRRRFDRKASMVEAKNNSATQTRNVLTLCLQVS